MMARVMKTALTIAAIVVSLPACSNNTAVQEREATEEVTKLLPLVKEDVEQVRKGLPEGAKKLGEILDPDPGANPASLQRAIATARDSVKTLQLAKSTFFSFIDTNGVVLRSEADPDLLAHKNVFTTFPVLKKAIEPTSGLVEIYGEMPEMRGVRTGADLAWAVAHPVKDKDGAVKGAFLTGWSFRRFALVLEEAAKRDTLELATKEGKKQPPIIYVFVVKGSKAYGAPVTPDVNADEVEKLGLVEKTAAGSWKTTFEITGRSFSVAAQRAPELGSDAAIAVMLSEI